MDDRPLPCDLLAHASLNLERNVSVEAARQYKLIVLSDLDDVARLVNRDLPDLTVRDCEDLHGAHPRQTIP